MPDKVSYWILVSGSKASFLHETFKVYTENFVNYILNNVK